MDAGVALAFFLFGGWILKTATAPILRLTLCQTVREAGIMLIEDSQVREELNRLVGSLTSNRTLRADLMQEALIRLWQAQIQKPGQSKNWYLQNCRFHLQHYLALGRSIDSPKRQSSQIYPSGQGEEIIDWMDRFEGASTVLQDVSAQEIYRLLSNLLSPHELEVLHWLAEGLGIREIARLLNISHPMVLKHRRKIAALAAKLSIDQEFVGAHTWSERPTGSARSEKGKRQRRNPTALAANEA